MTFFGLVNNIDSIGTLITFPIGIISLITLIVTWKHNMARIFAACAAVVLAAFLAADVVVRGGWLDQPVINVYDKVFHNEKVPLDGYSYENCVFDHVTFVSNGYGPINMKNITISGEYSFTSNNKKVIQAIFDLEVLGFLKHSIVTQTGKIIHSAVHPTTVPDSNGHF